MQTSGKWGGSVIDKPAFGFLDQSQLQKLDRDEFYNVILSIPGFIRKSPDGLGGAKSTSMDIPRRPP
jgi:hypothetical protein